MLICDDGLDDDGDGVADFPADPGCESPTDPSEKSVALVCDDGLDNDADGFVDVPADPGCQGPSSFLENPACQDGINNDPRQDGLIDFDGGQSIHGACVGGVCPPGVSDPDRNGIANPDPQCVNRPWDKEVVACGLGAELVLPLALVWRTRRRSARSGSRL